MKVKASGNDEGLQRLLKRFHEKAEGVEDSLNVKRTREPLCVDGQQRLMKNAPEFFTKEDFARLNDMTIPTARPVEREGTISVYDFGEYLSGEVEKRFLEELTLQVDSGIMSQEEKDALLEKVDNIDKRTISDFEKLVEASRDALRDREEPRPEGMTQIESLMYDWHIPEMLSFENKEGGLPVARLSHPNGEQLTIHLQGTYHEFSFPQAQAASHPLFVFS